MKEKVVTLLVYLNNHATIQSKIYHIAMVAEWHLF
jgi:hypothetical protein